MTSKHDDTDADKKNSTPYPEIAEEENLKPNGFVVPNKDSGIARPLDADKGIKGTEAYYHDLANNNGNTLTPLPIKSTPDIHSSVTTDTFSDASQTFWGYIDAQKITQRTGIAIRNLPKFNLKEVLDNGCDTVEDNSSSSNSITVNSLQPKVTTWITKENKDLLRIVTRNTNYGNKKTFDRARLNAIFNYDNFHSSKLNQYKVTRGALGDAMKEWPTISYALTNNNISATEDKQWNHPLIIRHNKTEFKIQTHIDRSIKRIIPNIEEVHDKSIDNYTEVEFKLPIIPEIEDEMSLSNFWLYCTKYVLWSTHIAFEFHLSYDNRDLTIDIPATQAMSSTFVNTNSIYGYSLREFENFIYNIHDTKQTIYDALVNRKFREAGWNYFSANPISKISIKDLKKDPKLIKEIYDLLRRSMQPMRKLPVPYDVSVGGNSKKSRKEGLVERFEAVKLSSVLIDIDRAVYMSVNGTVTIDSNNGKISNDSWNYTNRENNKSAIKFPFFFEILAIPMKYCEDIYFKAQIKKDGLIFFGGVNYSTTPADSRAYFSDTTKESYTYGYNGKNADGLIELLRECGFAGDWYNEHYKIEPSKQKQPCVVIAHLVSPKVEYLAGYGKSFINLEPYADTIAKATVELAAKMPSKLAYDKHLRDMERLKAGKSKDSIVFYLTELLQTRWGTEDGNKW